MKDPATKHHLLMKDQLRGKGDLRTPPMALETQLPTKDLSRRQARHLEALNYMPLTLLATIIQHLRLLNNTPHKAPTTSHHRLG